MWRTHFCVPRRHSWRRLIAVRRRVEKSLDTARRSACALTGQFFNAQPCKSKQHWELGRVKKLEPVKALLEPANRLTRKHLRYFLASIAIGRLKEPP